MNDYRTITRNEFLELSNEDIARIVKLEGRPKTGVFISDGSRRSAIVFMGLQPDKDNFEKKYIEAEAKNFLNNIKIIFQHGLHTLIIPSLKHENYEREKKNIDAMVHRAIKTLLLGEDWLNFYKEYGVKVKVYGDLDYVKQKGYPEIMEWSSEVEELTKNNRNHRIFYGIACSNIYEHRRLMDLAVDFYKKNNRKPSDEEKIQLYYGDKVDDVDFLIRSTIIRDSDLQPPIISGRKTQMYFFVAPDHISFSTDSFREILYDLIFSREPAFGKKEYKENELNQSVIKFMKEYYILNKSEVIGLGEKIGPFWVPQINIQMPKKE
jgi:undecaprenyl diphosphate synthase